MGVGEEVFLTFVDPSSPGATASWTATDGSLDVNPPATAGTNFWTAPDHAASVLITAIGENCTASITFEVIEPSDVRMKLKAQFGIGHIQNRPYIAMRTDVYILPADVCFYAISVQEELAQAVCSIPGVYAPFNGLPHDPNPAISACTFTVEPGFGTHVETEDIPRSGDPGTPAPFAPGSIFYDIHYKFKVGNQPMRRFTTAPVHHECKLESDGETLTISKATAGGSCTVSSGTTWYVIP